MIYIFGEYELDLDRAELRSAGRAIPLEPLPFSLLCLLVENHHRVVSKEEIVEKIWEGRFITDAALSTGIRSVRRALGDDGKSQDLLRTVRGRGFHFVGDVKLTAPRAAIIEPAPGQDQTTGKPTIAVLPFQPIGDCGLYGTIGDAIPSELISSLSRLRWLTVISRGSSFRFRGTAIDVSQIREALSATYCLTGLVEMTGSNLAVVVDLNDTRNNSVIWSDRYSDRIDNVQAIRTEIVHSVIRALELHIPLNEIQTARLISTEHLDAWSSYHLGLQHMYRFTKADNLTAAGLFERAVTLDPHFARAYAGLSFTSFQEAFLKYGNDPVASAQAARRYAERSMELDPADSTSNFVLGRALWLDGDPDAGLPWLQRATEINPNHAQGFYSRAWADIMADRAVEGRQNVDAAMALSPIDPLLYAMYATRAITHLQNGEQELAATWADRAARAPGAHFLIGLIAVAALARAGHEEPAAQWAENVRTRRPDASLEHFFRSFPFRKPATRALFQGPLTKFGF